MSIEPFLKLHTGIPREGPGSDVSTRKALSRLPELSPSPRILDLGCGPGRQTLVLASELQSPVIAVDIYQQYLDVLKKSAEKAGLSDLIQARNVSMEELGFEDETLDLVWSEGALYTVGVLKELRYLRPMLRSKGIVAFTEISWLRSDPSGEAVNFWKAYPDMRTIEQNVEEFRAAGYAVFHHFTLPPNDWWNEYYDPLLRRVADLRADSLADVALADVLDATEKEIELYRRCSQDYGYVFYLCSKE